MKYLRSIRRPSLVVTIALLAVAAGLSSLWALQPGPTKEASAHRASPRDTGGVNAPVRVDVGDNWFCDATYQGDVCDTVVNIGTTVEWVWVGNRNHTVTECGEDFSKVNVSDRECVDADWGSPRQNQGTWSKTFDKPGTHYYLCEPHPVAQRGRIIVRCQGDANLDGKVDMQDVAIVLAALNTQPGDPGWNPAADINGNGIVTQADLALVINAMHNSPCGQARGSSAGIERGSHEIRPLANR
jgi:plastocyanin